MGESETEIELEGEAMETTRQNGQGTAAVPFVRARGLGKTFAGKTVLQGVDLDLMSGEVRGLLGQNGCGKSTLVKILSGYHAPDPGGSLEVHGEEIELPLQGGDSAALGMSFVHQDLGLVDSMTVAETMLMGRYDHRLGWRIPWKYEHRRVREMLESFDISVRTDARIGDLDEVDQARLAILRAIDRLRGVKAGLLVLDEPTAYLPKDGVDQLFAAIREVSARGVAVILVTHRLDEVAAITDRVTVLRDGKLIGTHDTASLSEDQMIEKIVGFSLDKLYPDHHEATGGVAVSVRGLRAATIDDVSFDVREGEILGVTGLLGMGYEEVPYAMFGDAPVEDGMLSFGGVERELSSFSAREAVAAGMALLPADRLANGGAGEATVRENVTLTSLSSYFSGGLLRVGRERNATEAMLDEFDVVPPEPERVFATLSGGNQQKALLGKWFATSPSLLLLHDPTRGIDVGAKKQVFLRIKEAADAGASVVIASPEYEDLAHICDRVIVFRDGRTVAELRGGSLTEERLLEQCYVTENERGTTRAGTSSDSSER